MPSLPITSFHKLRRDSGDIEHTGRWATASGTLRKKAEYHTECTKVFAGQQWLWPKPLVAYLSFTMGSEEFEGSSLMWNKKRALWQVFGQQLLYLSRIWGKERVLLISGLICHPYVGTMGCMTN